MVILTTGFCEIEFSRTFSLLLLPPKKYGKIQIEISKMSKSAGNSNSQIVKKCGKIQIAKTSKSARKFKFLKCQKVRKNSNSPNPVANITISYILGALLSSQFLHF